MGSSAWSRRISHPAASGPGNLSSARSRALARAGVRPAALSYTQVSRDGRMSVVGESHYQDALWLAAGGQVCDGGFEDALDTASVLIPEPNNPYDRWAVRVDALVPEGAVTVGYLSAETCREYHEVLRGVPAAAPAWCPGKIMGGGRRFYGIHLHLADAETLLLTGPQPVSARFLPPERTVSVSGEDDHLDVLGSLLTPDSGTVRLVTELGWCDVLKGKYTGERVVEVRFGGSPVGQLTVRSTARYEKPLEAIHAAGRVPICEALLRAGEKGPQLVLRLPAG